MPLDTDKPRLRHPEKAHKPDNPVQRKKPDWIRVKAPVSREYHETRQIVREHKLTTVCEEACPNIGECWAKRHATMMIMGEICTRACSFCNVATGKPGALDPFEPTNVAQAVSKLGLKHVVITSVDRDDLDDGGAQHFADTIRAIRESSPETTIEILTPDFLRKPGARCFQPQSGDGAAPLRPGPPRCALLPFPASSGRGEGDRPGDFHEIGDHGRSWRGQGRGFAGDGRRCFSQ